MMVMALDRGGRVTSSHVTSHPKVLVGGQRPAGTPAGVAAHRLDLKWQSPVTLPQRHHLLRRRHLSKL